VSQTVWGSTSDERTSSLALSSDNLDCQQNALISHHCSVLLLQISGAVIAPVSILFMIYAIYNKRTQQLLTRSTLRYDDARGPWLLTILLILVTLLVIVLALEGFKAASKT
jgi:hypothetical protein